MIRELLEKIRLFETPEEDARFKKRYEEEKAKEEEARFKKRYEEEKAKEEEASFKKRYEEEQAKKAKEEADRKAKQKLLLPVDKNVKALQKEIETAGGKFPKFGADGRWGNETAGVVFGDPNYIEIARKYADTIPQVKSILSAKDQAREIATRPDVASAGNASTTVNGQSNSAAQATSDDERINSLVDQRMKAQQDAAGKAAKDAQLKALIKEPEAGSTGYAISPKNGMIYYTDAGRNNNQPAPLRLQDANSALYKDIFGMIKDAGLTVKGSPPKQSWTDWGEGYAMIDPTQLASVGVTPAVQGNSAAQQDTYSLLPPGTPPGVRPGEARLRAPMHPTTVLESDELNRIVSLVHHR